MTPAATTTPDIETLGLSHQRRFSLLLDLSFFATIFAVDQTLKLPFQFLLRNQLHLTPQAMAGFSALGGLAAA